MDMFYCLGPVAVAFVFAGIVLRNSLSPCGIALFSRNTCFSRLYWFALPPFGTHTMVWFAKSTTWISVDRAFAKYHSGLYF
jgi:hypothetical protein